MALFLVNNNKCTVPTYKHVSALAACHLRLYCTYNRMLTHNRGSTSQSNDCIAKFVISLQAQTSILLNALLDGRTDLDHMKRVSSQSYRSWYEL